MTKITLKHEINCSVDRFWEIFLDKSFNESLFRDHLQFPHYEILRQEETEGRVTRIIKGQPNTNMPKAVMKVVGDGFGYEEDGHLDRASQTWHFKMKTSVMPDKLRTEGQVTCEPIGDDRCRRVAVIEMEAKVFGVGKMIEQSTEKEMREGWDKSARFMNDWIAKGS